MRGRDESRPYWVCCVGEIYCACSADAEQAHCILKAAPGGTGELLFLRAHGHFCEVGGENIFGHKL